MIPEPIKTALNKEGKRLEKILLDFYGKVTFNFYNGKYVSFNAEQTVKKNNLNEGVKNEDY